MTYFKAQREIFSALGQNFYIKDGKVFITANEWFRPIKEAYPEFRAEFERLGLREYASVEARNVAFATLILEWGRVRNGPIPNQKQDRAVILSDDLGQSQNDLLTILLDEGYMQIVREKLSLLPTKRKNSKSRNLAQNSRVFCPV